MKPSIKKGIIITSICAFTLVGIKFYLNSSNTIEVHSVSSLNTGYWDNPSTSTGLVSNSDTQSVLYDSSKTITQVFVKEGQQVSVGDPLLSYDLTTLFGNLLDNAYEACLSVDEKQRFIYMHLYRFNNFIILCICNSYRKNENTNLFGSHIVFKESDKGIGLNNVTDVINKYNGQMEILRKQEEFEVRIVPQ